MKNIFSPTHLKNYTEQSWMCSTDHKSDSWWLNNLALHFGRNSGTSSGYYLFCSLCTSPTLPVNKIRRKIKILTDTLLIHQHLVCVPTDWQHISERTPGQTCQVYQHWVQLQHPHGLWLWSPCLVIHHQLQLPPHSLLLSWPRLSVQFSQC